MEPNEQTENEYLKEIAPSLFEPKLDLEPETPEGYFEDFSAKLNAKILEEEGEEQRSTRVFRLINYRNLAIAASVAAILAFLPFLKEESVVEPSSDITQENLLALDLDEDDLSDYLDMETLYESVEEDDLDTYHWSDDISEEELIEFLYEEEVSEELIINELQLNL